jgi:hypothetical protein
LPTETTINLDDAEKGLIAEQASSQVIMTEQKQLVYEKSGQKPEKIVYNTLSTPREVNTGFNFPMGQWCI